MSYTKWIGAWLGWVNTQSILGGIAGFVFGAIVDSLFGGKDPESFFTSDNHGPNGPGVYTGNENVDNGQRNGFLFSFMVLTAYIVKADGKVMHSEMEAVRRFLRSNFGEEGVRQGEQILSKLFDYHKTKGDYMWRQQLADACREMSANMETEHMLQMVAFLAEIIKADGRVDPQEVEALRLITSNLGLGPGVVDQMLHLGGQSIDDAYAVLGLAKDCSDDDVRKAYRKMALQYHPDRVATLGEDVKAAAQKKFQEINDAKERIFKARGL